jgi:PTS system N-acetylgalactosamine-specific IIA component
MKIVVTGHGKFADGIKSTVELLMGPIEEIKYVNFTDKTNESELDNEFKAILAEGDKTVFFCDLFGGTPFKRAVVVSDNNSDTAVVAGCNIGSLIEVGMQLKSYSHSAADLARQLIGLSKAGTRPFVKKNLALQQDNDFSDGI